MSGKRTFPLEISLFGKAGSATNALQRFAATIRRNVSPVVSRLGTALKGLGNTAKWAGLAIGGIGALAMKEFMEFESGIARINTLLPAGQSAMADFGDTVKRDFVRFGQSATDTTNAVFQSISGGIKATSEDVALFNDVLGKAAVGGFTTMEVAADTLTTILNTLGLATKDAMGVSDKLFMANILGKTTFEELGGSIGRVLPTATTMGASLEETLSAIVALTKTGLKTSEATSAINAMLSNIAAPTAKAQAVATKYLKQWGGTKAFSLASLKAQGLAGFLKMLTTATQGNAQAQKDLFGTIEGFNAIANLTTKQGAAEFTQALDAMAGAAGTTEKSFNDAERTTWHKMRQIKQGLSLFASEAGAGIVEGLGLDSIVNVPDKIESMAKSVKEGSIAFAQGFKEGLAPLLQAQDSDWQGLARSLGEAAGTLSVAMTKLAQAAGWVISKLAEAARNLKEAWDLIHAPSGAQKHDIAAKRLGGEVVRRNFREELKAQKELIAPTFGTTHDRLTDLWGQLPSVFTGEDVQRSDNMLDIHASIAAVRRHADLASRNMLTPESTRRNIMQGPMSQQATVNIRIHDPSRNADVSVDPAVGQSLDVKLDPGNRL